jgi:hypothetical protein
MSPRPPDSDLLFCLSGFCNRFCTIAEKDPGNHYKIYKCCSNQSAVAFDCTPLTLPDGPGDGTEGRVPSSIEGGGMPAMARIWESLNQPFDMLHMVARLGLVGCRCVWPLRPVLDK